jgi:hypothetical protein
VELAVAALVKSTLVQLGHHQVVIQTLVAVEAAAGKHPLQDLADQVL